MMNIEWLCRNLGLLLPVIGGVLGSTDDSWSMNIQPEVRAIDGYPVVLPCTFSHPRYSQHSSLQVFWSLGHGPAAVILYRCTSTPALPTCDPGPKQDQRYRLEGNPKEHDLSLRITSATLQDNGRYYCRVEVQGQNHIAFEDKMGTRLRVEAPPKILGLTVEGSEQSGLRAVCQVQGSPLPDVQWLSTVDSLEVFLAGSLAQEPEHNHHIVSQLTNVAAGQQYTCSTSNPLGRAQSTLYMVAFQAQLPELGAPTYVFLLISMSLVLKVFLLVGTLMLIVWEGQQKFICWKETPIK